MQENMSKLDMKGVENERTKGMNVPLKRLIEAFLKICQQRQADIKC